MISLQVLSVFSNCLLNWVQCTLKVMFKWINRNRLTKTRHGTRCKDFHLNSVFLCVFCSSVKKYSALLSDFSGVMCHVSPPSQTETNSTQFAPFTWSFLTINVLHFADLFCFLKWYLKCCNIILQLRQFYFLFPPSVCCMAIKQCDHQESFLSTSRLIFY